SALIALMLSIGGVDLAGAQTSPRAIGLDAAPAAESTPDPLTPPDASGPAPVAPGAPVTPGEPRAAQEIHPIVALLRDRLPAPLARASAAEREDYAGLAAFYAEGSGEPVWTSTGGVTPHA